MSSEPLREEEGPNSGLEKTVDLSSFTGGYMPYWTD